MLICGVHWDVCCSVALDLDGNRVGDGRLSSCWTGMSQQEIVDSNFSVDWFKERLEQLNDDALETVAANRVEVVFSIATDFQDAGLFEQRQVMADRRLTLIQSLAEFCDVEFFVLQQEEDNTQTIGVRKHLAEMSQFGPKLG